MSFIKNLLLTNYRVYKNNSFNFENNINIIYGKNGLGKTNILESISMLSPGKGLLNADVDEILKVGEQGGWSVFANVGESDLADTLAVYTEEGKKKIKLNGNPMRGQEGLNKVFNIVWLTPSMQNFFSEEKSVRRKFLDRCVYLIDNQHASRVAKYEYLVRERMKVLQDACRFDVNWLNVLESKIAETGVEIAVAREEVVKKLNEVMEKYDFDFPKFELRIDGAVSCSPLEGEQANEVSRGGSNTANNSTSQAQPQNESRLDFELRSSSSLPPTEPLSAVLPPPQGGRKVQTTSAVQGGSDYPYNYVDNYKKILFANRQRDKESKRTNEGVHKADLRLFYHTKNIDAQFSSTGEQKLFLISLTLLKAFMCLDMEKATPIILLDEVFSYLDNKRKTDLLNELKKLKVQCFITATDIEIFGDLIEKNMTLINMATQ